MALLMQGQIVEKAHYAGREVQRNGETVKLDPTDRLRVWVPEQRAVVDVYAHVNGWEVGKEFMGSVRAYVTKGGQVAFTEVADSGASSTPTPITAAAGK